VSLVLHVVHYPGEMHLAVAEQGELVDFALWRPGAPDHVGDCFLARIEALVPGMGGAFVDLGLDTAGFLPLPKDAPPLTQGQAITVVVTRAAQGGKGVRVRLASPDGALPPDSPRQGAPRLIATGPTPLDRLAALWPAACLAVDSPAAAAVVPPALRERRLPGFHALPEDIAAACAALEEAEVSLPGGLSATITPTPALIAIDMDAPPTQGTLPKQTAQYAANKAALPALMSQIRLRNLSGAIVIDPAGLAIRKRQALLAPVQEALQADPLRPRCLGVTALGLIEILRPRVLPSLPELLGSAHGRALAALRHIVTHAPGTTSLYVGSRILHALEHDPQAVADCTHAIGHVLNVVLAPALPDLHWSLKQP
jgi:hypothetical protein